MKEKLKSVFVPCGSCEGKAEMNIEEYEELKKEKLLKEIACNGEDTFTIKKVCSDCSCLPDEAGYGYVQSLKGTSNTRY